MVFEGWKVDEDARGRERDEGERSRHGRVTEKREGCEAERVVE